MYKRILVPLDGSSFAEEMLPWATALAAIHATGLVFVRVIDKDSDQDEARHYIERLAAAHDAHGLCLSSPGDVPRGLLDEVEREPATLLAMSSRGHSGLAEFFLGSVAQRVLRGARGPVLLYRPVGAADHLARPPSGPHSVILPLDGLAHSEAVADDAGRFAHWLGAELEVVSVIGPLGKTELAESSGGEMAVMETSYVRAKANELGKRYSVPINWDVLHGDPVDALVQRVAHRRDAILAMATRRERALDAAVLGSVAAACLRKAGVPILMRVA